MFPNPTDGIVYVEGSDLSGNGVQVLIYDIVGKVIFDCKYNLMSSKFNAAINLNYNAKGMYIMEIKNNTAIERRTILLE